MKVDKTKWEKSNIADSCEIQLGTRIVKKQAEKGGFPVYGGGGATFTTNTYNRENAILVSRFALSEECTRFVPGKFYLNDSGLTLVPKNESKSIIFDFLKWQIFSLNDKIYSLARGAAQKNLDMKRFPFLPILLPTLSEQQAIATELDAIQKIIDGYKAQLEDLDALAQSIFLDMFGDPVTNPKGWETPKLTEFATLINGRAYSQPELLDNGKYRVLRVGNLFSTKDYYYSDLELEPNKYIEKGDLIYAWSCTFGAYIWKEDKVIYHYHIWKVELKEHANKTFVMFVLNLKTKELMNQLHGVGMMHFTKTGMEKNEFILPPLTLQQQFATRVEQIEKQKELIRLQLADAKTVMAERMQYYFS